MLALTTSVLIMDHRPAAGQQPDPPDQPATLDDITVEAAAVEKDKEETQPSFITVIPGKDLEDRFTSIPEALSETVGVQVSQFGGLGNFSTISIRGSSSEQVLVYLDGILLNEAQSGTVNLGTIPISHIESIEIYRGSSPISFGQTGIGGIVNIKTKSTLGKKQFSAHAQYGSYGTYRLDAMYSDKPGRLDYMIGANYTSSKNNFKFLNDNGTQFNTSDDVEMERLNNQFESFNLVARVGYDLTTDTRISLYHNFLQTDKGVPGLGAFQSLHANFKTSEHRTSLELDQRALLSPDLNLIWVFQHTYKEEFFKDLYGELGTGNQNNDYLTQSYELLLKPDYLLGSHQKLKGILRLKLEQFSSFDQLQGIEVGTSTRRTVSIGAEDTVTFFNGQLFFVPSVLYDLIDSTFDGVVDSVGQAVPSPGLQGFLTLQFGSVYRITDGLEIRGNIGRYFRPPNFFELFGDRGGTVGNPELQPEEGFNKDIGFRYAKRFKSFIREVELQAAYFENQTDNLILFIQTSQRTSRPENIGKAETTGQEVVVKLRLGSYFKVSGNYTHQRAVNKSNIPSQTGKILPGRPVHEFSGRAELFSSIGSLFYTYDFTAQNYLDQVNQIPTTSRSIHDIGITAKPMKPVSITFEIKNLTNDQIEDVFGYPLPGRSYFLTVQADF